MKTLQILGILLSVGMLSVSCSDKDETPEYKIPTYEIPEGVYVSTPEILLNKSTDASDAFNLAIYSSDSVFPIRDLSYSTVLMFPVSKSVIFLRPHDDNHARRPALCLISEFILFWEHSRYAKNSEIEGIDNVLELYYEFPGEGQYDFYLRFLMFKGYYYITPVYRLTVEENPENKGSYFTKITILNNN